MLINLHKSNIMIYIYNLLVLTKRLVFKNFLTKILFTSLVIMLFSSFNTRFPVPLWITFLESSDGNTHVCHRKDYLEFMEMVSFTEIDSSLVSNYEQCDYLIKHDEYENWERVGIKSERIITDNKMDVILCKTRPYYVIPLNIN